MSDPSTKRLARRLGAWALGAVALAPSCGPPPPPALQIDVAGLRGTLTLSLTSTATSSGTMPRVVSVTFDTAAPTRVVPTEFAEEATLDIAIVDQPDRPPQRCTLDADHVAPRGRLTVTCADVELCGPLFRRFATATPVFGDLDAWGFMQLEWIEAGGFYLVPLLEGRVVRFDPDASPLETEPLLDIGDRVEAQFDDGLLSATLHPDYPTVTSLFVQYVAHADPRTIRVSRFELATDGTHYDPASEDVLVEGLKVPGRDSHSGGTVRFGPDGYLYASLGDGGFIEPPSRNAQDTTNVLGSMIRIDVDVPAGMHFAIPADNPFAPGGTHPGEGRPEIYAWGFRNPFRWSFDSATGDLWLGDVGWASWEEIDLVRLGGDYGWPVFEGTRCHDASCDPTAFTAPAFAYAHDQGSSAVVGGFVYHGDDFPALRGAYLFSDFNRRALFALHDPSGPASTLETVAYADVDVVSVSPDERGEPLLVGLSRIARLTPGEAGAFTPPGSILETGCMDLDAPTSLHPALEPYEVNAPLFSDGTDKGRFVWIPEGATATADATGDLLLPPGTVLAKEFWRGDERLETRFLVALEDGGWNAFAYRWSADQTDATLVREPIVAPSAHDPRNWLYPAPAQCAQCHTSAAGHSLGLELAELDRTILVGGERVSQLEHWRSLGWLASATSPVAPMVPLDDASASVETRVRDYLHANCAPCHRQGNPLRVAFDLRREVPLADTGLCGAPMAEGFSLAHVVEPGDPDASVLAQRLSSTDALRMPPLGRLTVDDAGVALVRAWIESLGSCP